MAEQENSFIDDSKDVEIHSGDSLSKVMRFNESDMHDDNSVCDGEIKADRLSDNNAFQNDVKLTEPITGGLNDKSFYDNDVKLAEPTENKLLDENSFHDDVKLTEPSADKLHEDTSLCDDVAKLTEPTANSLLDNSSLHNDVKLTEPMLDKLDDDKSFCSDDVVKVTEPMAVISHNDNSCCDDEIKTDRLHDDRSFCDDVGRPTVDKLNDNKSCSDHVVKLTEPVLDKMYSDKSFRDDVAELTERIAEKLSEFKVNKSSVDSVTESQYCDYQTSSDCRRSTSETYWHSSPSVHCHSNQSACPAVSAKPMLSSDCGNQSQTCVVTESLSAVIAGQCDQERVISDCSPVHYQSSAAAGPDAAVTNDGVLSHNKSTPVISPDCDAVESNDGSSALADKAHPHTELTAAAVAAGKETACIDGNRELTNCQSSVNDVKDKQQLQHHWQTTESVCLELSEMMRECVIDDNAVKQMVNGTDVGDADVSDSFDLDVAARDLERAVSAGMLDFLLESYEDSDEDISSEQLCEELDKWSPPLLSDDDDDDDDGCSSESTLTESPSSDSDDSVVAVVDDDNDDDVLRRHERIMRHLKKTVNDDDDDDDHNTAESEPDAADVESTSDDDDVLRHHERIKRHLKKTVNDDDDDDDDHNTADSESDAADVEATSDDNDVLRCHERIRRHLKRMDNNDGEPDVADTKCTSDADNADGAGDVIDVNDSAVLKRCERVMKRVKSSDHDDCCDVDICADDCDDDVLARHERVKQLLKSAAATVDKNKCKTKDADVATTNSNCSCSDDDNDSSLHARCLMNADNVDDSSTADDGTVNGTQVAVIRDRTSSSSNDKQSDLCRNVESMSSVVNEYGQHDVQDALNAASSHTCDVESAGILSPCRQRPPDIQNTDTECNNSGETSFLLGELGAGSTSTPSSCSHHSQLYHSVIEWREGIYNGLCRHSDGSEIRML